MTIVSFINVGMYGPTSPLVGLVDGQDASLWIWSEYWFISIYVAARTVYKSSVHDATLRIKQAKNKYMKKSVV